MRDRLATTLAETLAEALAEASAEDGPGVAVEDLTGIQAAQPPRGWGPEIAVASLAASRLPNAYVVMEPGQVTIDGQATDAADRQHLTDALLERAGDTVALVLRIRIPPRVIAPFAFSAFRQAGAGIRLERCAARSYDEQAALLDRLTGAGVAHPPDPCPVGLGGPGGDWPAAVTAGLQALAALPAGRIDIEYRDARLTAEPPTSAGEFDDGGGRLPIGAARGIRRHGRAARAGYGRAGRRRARALLDAPGARPRAHRPHAARCRTRAAKQAIETEAAALFGADQVESALAIAGADAAAGMGGGGAARARLPPAKRTEGEADLAGATLSLAGRVTRAGLVRTIHDRALAELPDYRVETAFVVDLPAALRTMPLPPARCAAEINRINRDPAIDFATGSAVFAADSEQVLDALARVLDRCVGGAIEVGGHTDAQGPAEVNLRLSLARAEAVVTALAERGVPLDRIVAAGFGEERPVAGNESDAGRAQNRRIDFEPAG